MKTEEEITALNNLLGHFKLPFVIVNKYFNNKRIKTKFYLVMGADTKVSSPVLDYNQMNHFILGMGMAVEYIK